MGVEWHNQSNKSQNPSQTQDQQKHTPTPPPPRGGGGWWPKMLEFGANPPSHLCPPILPTKQ